MTGTAGEGFGAHPFGEIARAMVAAQAHGLELARAWSDSLRELVGSQAEGGRLVQAALESFTTTTRAQLELARALLTPLGAQPEAFGGLVQSWNDAFLRLLEAAPGAQPERPARDR